MSNYQQMFQDAVRDTLSELYCIHHTDVELQTTEVTSTQKVSWSDEQIKVYHDIEYCPECFRQYEKGKRFKHDIKTKPLFTNIKRSKHARHKER